MSDTEVFKRIKDTCAAGGTLTQGEARWLVGEVLALREDLRAVTRQRDTTREVADQWDAKWRQEVERLRQQLADLQSTIDLQQSTIDSDLRTICGWRDRALEAEQALAQERELSQRLAVAAASAKLALDHGDADGAYVSLSMPNTTGQKIIDELAQERAGAREMRRVLETIKRRGVIGSPHRAGCECAYCLAEAALAGEKGKTS